MNVYRPQDDPKKWWAVGSTGRFDGPGGARLSGKIVRRSTSNINYFEVEVEGRRHEAWLSFSNMEMVWS